MNNPDVMIHRHYGFVGIMDRILVGLEGMGKDINSMTVDDLAPIDEFHTRGREATVEVAQLVNLASTDRVLDVGCGLGGTARHLAEHFGCHVTGVDLTEEYITAGTRLVELVGLDDMVELQEGSALDLPWENECFDVVWTEHVQMNIADKDLFYSEISRVLKPGGRLVFHDVFRGVGDPPTYPVPWAEDESLSHLITDSDTRTALDNVGLTTHKWIGKDDESAAFFGAISTRIATEGPPPLGIHLLMGDNAAEKIRNCLFNLKGNCVTVAMGMASKQ